MTLVASDFVNHHLILSINLICELKDIFKNLNSNANY